MVNVFAPQLHDSETALTPEVAGVEIGASVEDLENKIGPASPGSTRSKFQRDRLLLLHHRLNGRLRRQFGA